MKEKLNRPDGYDALPKRFKDYIQQLETENAGLVKSRPSATATNLKVVNHLSETPTYLPDRTRLQFTIGKDEFEVHATEHGELEIMSRVDSLAVLPGVSNVVSIVGRRRA